MRGAGRERASERESAARAQTDRVVQTGSRAARVDAEALDAAYFAESVVRARTRASACASARTSAHSRACARTRVCRSGWQRQLKAPRQHDGVRRRLARELVGDALHDGCDAKDQHDKTKSCIERPHGLRGQARDKAAMREGGGIGREGSAPNGCSISRLCSRVYLLRPPPLPPGGAAAAREAAAAGGVAGALADAALAEMSRMRITPAADAAAPAAPEAARRCGGT